MLILAVAALAASIQQPQPQPRTTVAVQATATVRILSGVRLRLGEELNSGAPRPRNTVIRSGESTQPAKLIEFE